MLLSLILLSDAAEAISRFFNDDVFEAGVGLVGVLAVDQLHLHHPPSFRGFGTREAGGVGLVFLHRSGSK